MKKVCLLVIIALMISLNGCSRKTTYEIMHDVSDIESVQIVENVRYNLDSHEWEYDPVCEIVDVETFIAELLTIECYVIINDPPQMSETAIVVRIDYNNGDYELISKRAQRRQRIEGHSGEGVRSFDSEQFNALIGKYIEMSEE